MLSALLFTLALGVVGFTFVLFRAALASGSAAPKLEAVAVGAAVNIFDTLGIGTFAPTLTWLKLRAQLPDRLIPCTMIVACTLPTMLQSAIFLVLLGVHVDAFLLVAYAIALLAGGLVGQRLVVRVRVWIVQAVVAAALLIAAALYALSNLHMMPAGGLAAAVISGRHVAAKVADLRIAIGFLLGGIPGVLIAAFVVKDMPVEWLRWLVIVVVIYAASVMLREAAKAYRLGPTSDPANLALVRAEGLTD